MSYVHEALSWLGSGASWAGPGGIAARLLEHLWLTLLVVGAAGLLAIPLGLVIGHCRRGAGTIGALTGAARAVPTLGVLTLFGLWLGIGVQAPFLALVILAIPSLLAGAYSGVFSLDPTIASASRAIGMSPVQVLTRVEVPLALPVLIGGVRAATLQVVSTATLAAYTADYGLGRFLFTGLKSRDYSLMLASSLLVIALALALDLLLGALQRHAQRHIPTSEVHP
ncbi:MULTISPECIES: ABC transporter permease [unclassified Corynebacterium]|uniref:ABC transporter permease n=1 Tax=unclassified Corynebacterium TaxID=2624378 RepID=UPI0029CA1D56|nr:MULTISPECIES: ABC transporter permease subunit [unclassified Corynebacterium]WPF65880.1 ABC transporter permease subunit [Corynebacterium sp. 22KM0430]WPF68373.1 ABC transporter permease subunit [Corynebacterium sp. 21KM1197]